MRVTENECVDCGRPCLGNACPNRNVTRFYCDRCGNETKLYHYDGEELCIDCIISDELEVVEGSYEN